MMTMHSVAKRSSRAGPVGAGLGRFSGYSPYSGLPLRVRRACRPSKAKTIHPHTQTHNRPAPPPHPRRGGALRFEVVFVEVARDRLKLRLDLAQVALARGGFLALLGLAPEEEQAIVQFRRPPAPLALQPLRQLEPLIPV